MQEKQNLSRTLSRDAFQFLTTMAEIKASDKVLFIGEFDWGEGINLEHNQEVYLIGIAKPSKAPGVKTNYLGASLKECLVVGMPQDFDWVITAPPSELWAEVDMIMRLRELIKPEGQILSLCSFRFLQGRIEAYLALRNFLEAEMYCKVEGFPLLLQKSLHEQGMYQTCILHLCLVDREQVEEKPGLPKEDNKSVGLKIDKIPSFDPVFVFNPDTITLGKATRQNMLDEYLEKGFEPLNQAELMHIVTTILDEAAGKSIKAVKMSVNQLRELNE